VETILIYPKERDNPSGHPLSQETPGVDPEHSTGKESTLAALEAGTKWTEGPFEVQT
jgi:hypothetical protein